MRSVIAVIIPTLILFSVHGALTKTLYTWTDKDGVVHITETKPPAGIQQTDKVTYKPKPKPEKTTRQVEKQKADERRTLMLEYDARRKAARLRREADKAKEAMDAGIAEANRMKAETDEYIRQWGVRSRYRKSIKAKIDRKKDATNQAVAESERLTSIAAEAEAKAREAEKELSDISQLYRESKDYTRSLEAETRSADANSE